MALHSGQSGVWPGYVAALAGVTVSILALIATLSLGILQAARTAGEIEHIEQERTAAAGSASPATAASSASTGAAGAGISQTPLAADAGPGGSSAAPAQIAQAPTATAAPQAAVPSTSAPISASPPAEATPPEMSIAGAMPAEAAPPEVPVVGAMPAEAKTPGAATPEGSVSETPTSPSRAATEAARPAEQTSPPGRPRVVLNFAHAAVRVPQADRAKVVDGLRRLSLGPDVPILVCAYAPGGTADQRTAYLRALGIREMLMESGRAASTISLRIASAPRGGEVAIQAASVGCASAARGR